MAELRFGLSSSNRSLKSLWKYADSLTFTDWLSPYYAPSTVLVLQKNHYLIWSSQRLCKVFLIYIYFPHHWENQTGRCPRSQAEDLNPCPGFKAPFERHTAPPPSLWYQPNHHQGVGKWTFQSNLTLVWISSQGGWCFCNMKVMLYRRKLRNCLRKRNAIDYLIATA